MYACLCMCVSALRLLITSGMMWHDIDSIARYERKDT